MSSGYEPGATNHHLNLLGSLTISIDGGGKHTYHRLFADALGDLQADLHNLFATDGSLEARVILQYAPGDDHKEAGSRWFDLFDFDGPSAAADAVINYLNEIEAGFASGLEFVQ